MARSQGEVVVAEKELTLTSRKKESYLGHAAVSFWKVASSDVTASPIVLDPGPITCLRFRSPIAFRKTTLNPISNKARRPVTGKEALSFKPNPTLRMMLTNRIELEQHFLRPTS